MIVLVSMALALAAPIPAETIKDAKPPTQAAKALTAGRLPAWPSNPESARFQCVIENSALHYCAQIKAAPYQDMAALISASGAWASGSPLGVAYRRLEYWSFPNSSLECPSHQDCATVLVTEIMSSHDLAFPEKVGTTDRKNLIFDPSTFANIANFYPPAAIRSYVTADVKATCLIGNDGSLLCRDPKATVSTQTGIDFDRQFERSTIDALAAVRVSERGRDGKSVVGYEFEMSLGWRLPD